VISIDVGSVPAEFPKKETGSSIAAPKARCRSKMLLALTAMRCIRKNLCSWSAVVIQMQESMKERIVCIGSLRRDRRSANGGCATAMAYLHCVRQCESGASPALAHGKNCQLVSG